MKDYNKISFFIVTYLTCCSSLYHISYWAVFNLNGLLYITISDLLKSSIQPILSVFYSSIISIFFLRFIARSDKVLPLGGGRNTSLGKIISNELYIYILGILWFGLSIYFYRIEKTYFWAGWAAFTAIPFVVYIFNSTNLLNEVKNKNDRFILIQIIVTLPFYSFAIGKLDAQLIFKNISYKYIIRAENKVANINANDTLKFIGASSQNVFFSDLKNNKIFIISKIDTIVLNEKK